MTGLALRRESLSSMWVVGQDVKKQPWHDELAARLVQWQWPDGGWNCDKNPGATNSSFMESLIPLRGLDLHARLSGSQRSQTAAGRI